MALNFKNIFEGLRIKAKSVLTSDTVGEVEVDSADGKMNLHNGTSRSPLVTEAHSATLTNKTLTSPVINSPTGIVKADVGLSAVDNTSDINKPVSTAQGLADGAVQAFAIQRANHTGTQAAGTITGLAAVATSGLKADVGLSAVDNTSDATKNAASVSLTNHTINGTLNTLTNITASTNANLTGPITSVGNATSITLGAITSTMILDGTILNSNINSSAAIARTKLASGTNGALLNNNGSGVMSESTDVILSTNAMTFAATKHLEMVAVTDSTTTGTTASLTAFTGGAIRLTNASLVSLANIPAGANGQEVVIFNRTGVSVSIVDSSAASGTAANRIYTGTSANITFAQDAALILSYDTTSSRWQVIGGTSSSGGGSSAPVDTSISALNIDWSTGDTFYKLISTGSTFTFSNSANGQTISVIIKNTGASNIDVVFPTALVTGVIISTILPSYENIYTFMKSNGKFYVSVIADMV